MNQLVDINLSWLSFGILLSCALIRTEITELLTAYYWKLCGTVRTQVNKFNSLEYLYSLKSAVSIRFSQFHWVPPLKSNRSFLKWIDLLIPIICKTFILRFNFLLSIIIFYSLHSTTY